MPELSEQDRKNNIFNNFSLMLKDKLNINSNSKIQRVFNVPYQIHNKKDRSVGIQVGFNHKGKLYGQDSDFNEIIDNDGLEYVLDSAYFNPILQYIDKRGNAKIMSNIKRDNIGKITIDSRNINRFFNIEIIGSEDSARIFGLKKAKERLLGTKLNNYSIKYGDSKTLGSETYYVDVPYKGRNIKFSLRDIKFIKFNLNGYNIPKDRTIKVNSIVRLISDKGKESKMTVIKVTPCSSSKNISRNSKNRKNDIIVVRDAGGNIKSIYAKYLKFLKNEN